MKVNVVFTITTLRIGLMIGLGLVLTVAVSDLRSEDSKADIYRREYARITTSIKNGNIADKLRHPRSVAYSVEH